MKKQVVFMLQFLIVLSSFSQQDAYHRGFVAFKNYDYKEALPKFEIASDSFLGMNDIKNYLKSQLYISNIKIYKNNYPSALKTINYSIKKYNSSRIQNDSLWGELMNTKALIYRLDGRSKEALEISDIILNEQLHKKTISKYNLIRTYIVRSNILYTIGKFDQAIHLIEKTLKLSDYKISPLERAALLNNLGSAYLLKADFDSALKIYVEAYRLRQENNAGLYELAITSFNIGVVSEAIGNYKDAIRYYQKSAEYDLKNQGEEVGFITDVYMAISGVYSKKNDLEKTEEYIEKALTKTISVFGDQHINTANVYTRYVRYLKLKKKDSLSLEYDKKALIIREKTYGVYHWFPIQNLMSIADTYTELKEYILAKKYYTEALQRAKKMNSGFQEAECYRGIGNLYMAYGDYKKAIDFFDKSYTNYTTHFNNNNVYTLEVDILRARALFYDKNYEKTLAIIEKHYRLNTDKIHKYPLIMIEAIHLDNSIAIMAYKKTRDIKKLKDSYNNIDVMIEQVQESKKEYTTDRSRIHAGRKNVSYYDKAIEICYVLFQNTKENKYLEKAFQLSEINRNSALVAGIKDEQFKKMAGVPDSLLQQENTLKRKLSSIKNQIYSEKESLKVDSLMSLQLHYRVKIENILHALEKEYPVYYNLKYTHRTISVSQLQKEYLDSKTSLIEYHVGEENIYVFVVNKNKVDFKKLPIAASIKSGVQKFRKQLLNQQNIHEVSRELYNLLLTELNLKKKIILVTGSVLNYLPFEALLEEKGYLLEKYSISYMGSASLLEILKKKRIDKKKVSWIGFAPKYKEDTSLISNIAEVSTIAKIMKGTAIVGSNASLENFILHTANTSVMHIAAHAEIDQENPMYNKLIFLKDKDELMASEIYTLSIPLELIVLSACNTGFGKLEKGEGIMSMSRAFHYAGTKSTIMSLWKVPDKETTIIMKAFYKNLIKGFPKDKALQNAKLEYLANTKDNLLKHPYYWAGFVVSGNVEAIITQTSYWWILVLVLISGSMIFRRKLVQFFK